jgi:hypothetical protein
MDPLINGCASVHPLGQDDGITYIFVGMYHFLCLTNYSLCTNVAKLLGKFGGEKTLLKGFSTITS